MKTAKQTKPFWGIVAVIGFMVACTMGNSLIMAGVGTAMLVAGAWLGGYMSPSTSSGTNKTTKPAMTGERRAA